MNFISSQTPVTVHANNQSVEKNITTFQNHLQETVKLLNVFLKLSGAKVKDKTS